MQIQHAADHAAYAGATVQANIIVGNPTELVEGERGEEEVKIFRTFAEAFTSTYSRLLVTALNQKWALTGATVATGYGTSMIGCSAEAGTGAPDRRVSANVGARRSKPAHFPVRARKLDIDPYRGSFIRCGRSLLRTQGLKKMWSGYKANVIRNSLMNTVEMIAFYQSKEFLFKRRLMEEFARASGEGAGQDSFTEKIKRTFR